MTEIRQQGFSIDLPGEWLEEPAEGPGVLRYAEQDGDGRLEVTLLGVRPSFAIADERMLLDQYLQHRTKYEKGRRPWLAQTEPVIAERDGSAEGSWDGDDPGTGRRLRHRVLLRGGMLADVCFEAPAGEFDERASAVLDAARVEERAEE